MIPTQHSEMESTQPELVARAVENAVSLYAGRMKGTFESQGLFQALKAWLGKVLGPALSARLTVILFDFRSALTTTGTLGSLAQVQVMPLQNLQVSATPKFFDELTRMDSTVQNFHKARGLVAA